MFSVNPEAQQRHEEGLRAESNGNYQVAHEAFASAQFLLTQMHSTIDVDVQSARIARDDGFTYVRSSIARNDFEDLDMANDVLEEATGKTLLWAMRGGNTSPGPEAPIRLGLSQWRELFAEHGASVSLLARLATVREVLTGEADEDTAEAYTTADKFLILGSNGYYHVNNAMVAARYERMQGNLLKTSLWVSKAVAGIALTAALDRKNLVSASETFGGRLGHLRSRSFASRSVTNKP